MISTKEALATIYDAVIIGAGPAGSSAAKVLDERGLDYILVDREKFPRNKPCAGVLSPKIRSLIDIPPGITERPLRGYRVFSPAGRIVESSFPEPGFIVQRTEFDAFLVNSLATKPVREKVTQIIDKGGFLEVRNDHWSCKARYIIGADGVNSVVRRYCGIPTNQVAAAAQCVVRLPADEIDQRVGNWFEVYYTQHHGYGWISPMKDSLRIGIGIITGHLTENIQAVLDRFMESSIVREKWDGGEIVKREAASIPMSGPLDRLTRPRILLCGDAGGFVYPGTGEGIFYAIKTGRIAAQLISRLHKEGDLDADLLEEFYSHELENNGLFALRDVDFTEKNLSSTENAEKYVCKLAHVVRARSVS
ncbi:MAG: geranylgeranyl reductase family protein [Candidatus Thermoplasmatota archaeon]|nr:geranylgeranyl reductase family protein [Candidatus Thermoplasmatota archaeon]MDP7266159.1 geranylgeranyl reductase family protein [Candidatus Thermoplasmatota archaeon]